MASAPASAAQAATRTASSSVKPPSKKSSPFIRKVTARSGTAAFTSWVISRPKRARFASDPPYSSSRRFSPGARNCEYQVAVRGMDLDGVVTGALRPSCRRDERCARSRDALLRHRLRDDDFAMPLLDTVRHGGRGDRRLARNVDPGMPAAMAKLDRGLRAGGVDHLD